MKIVVSACLIGKNCKYNGGNNRNEDVINFIDAHEVLDVCPEQTGGLPTPRVPAEIRNGQVINAQGVCVDEEFRRGAQLATTQAMEFGAQLAILQPRSPSCGCREIYDGTFSKRLIHGQGIFAENLSKQGIRIVEPNDLKHLTDE